MADEDWPAYYRVTVGRPPWPNLEFALDRFDEEEAPADGRFALDVGCGAGRDTRGMLARGWHVLALDPEPAAIQALVDATPEDDRSRLRAHIGAVEDFEPPALDLVNANVALQYVPEDRFAGVVGGLLAALRPGGRFAAMIFGDRDGAAGEPGYTCVAESVVRGCLDGFEIERWVEREEETTLALGDPHHLHCFEVVARKPR